MIWKAERVGAVTTTKKRFTFLRKKLKNRVTNLSNATVILLPFEPRVLQRPDFGLFEPL